MIEITEELIDEYREKNEYDPDEEFIQYMKDHFIGLHIDEKEVNKFFDACDDFYTDAYCEGYRNG